MNARIFIRDKDGKDLPPAENSLLTYSEVQNVQRDNSLIDINLLLPFKASLLSNSSQHGNSLKSQKLV